MEELVRMRGERWAVEACFAEPKGGVGLDRYVVGRLVPAMFGLPNKGSSGSAGPSRFGFFG